jgi:hypothetical protein
MKSGQVHHPDVPASSEEERAMGTILACCAVPESDVVIVD